MTFDEIEKKMTKHCNALNKLLEEVKKEYPDAEFYVDGTQKLNLMIGNAPGEVSTENIVCAAYLNTDCGDW